MTRKPRTRGWVRWLWRIPLGLLVAPLLLIAALRWIDPPTSAFMLQRQFAPGPEAVPVQLHYEWVDWGRIAPAMPLAAVAAEDQHFPEHWGFDLEAIAEAVSERGEGGRVRGASTISQQVAKNLFLWSGRSWLRKGLEVYLTGGIELLWPKRRILEVYLNIAQFGDTVFGVGAASRGYFDKTPEQLSLGEAALLAAVLPNPVRYRVDQPSAHVRARAVWIEAQMRQLGYSYLAGLSVTPRRMP
ncbi:MAG: monofunctional biosynthetic peptidoglycan transglycosylase [Gammaproteobacteria bacterium]